MSNVMKEVFIGAFLAVVFIHVLFYSANLRLQCIMLESAAASVCGMEVPVSVRLYRQTSVVVFPNSHKVNDTMMSQTKAPSAGSFPIMY